MAPGSHQEWTSRRRSRRRRRTKVAALAWSIDEIIEFEASAQAAMVDADMADMTATNPKDLLDSILPHHRIKRFYQIVMRGLLWGAGGWTLTAYLTARLESFELSYLRRILAARCLPHSRRLSEKLDPLGPAPQELVEYMHRL